MAPASKLITARKLLLALECGQSQASLNSQAGDCVDVVAALGYYDLANHLTAVAEHIYDPERSDG